MIHSIFCTNSTTTTFNRAYLRWRFFEFSLKCLKNVRFVRYFLIHNIFEIYKNIQTRCLGNSACWYNHKSRHIREWRQMLQPLRRDRFFWLMIFSNCQMFSLENSFIGKPLNFSNSYYRIIFFNGNLLWPHTWYFKQGFVDDSKININQLTFFGEHGQIGSTYNHEYMWYMEYEGLWDTYSGCCSHLCSSHPLYAATSIWDDLEKFHHNDYEGIWETSL